MKNKLIEAGFKYKPYNTNANGIEIPVVHELFGEYYYYSPFANFVLEVNDKGWFLFDGRPEVNKLYDTAKDISLEHIIRQIIKYSQKQNPAQH